MKNIATGIFFIVFGLATLLTSIAGGRSGGSADGSAGDGQTAQKKPSSLRLVGGIVVGLGVMGFGVYLLVM